MASGYSVNYRPNSGNIDALLYGRTGPIVLHLANTGRQVEGAARRRVGVKSGKLKGGISSRLVRAGGKDWTVEVAASAKNDRGTDYAMYHHEGSRAVNGKLMVFEVGGATVYTMRRKAIPPNPFMRDALKDVGL